eukprot:6771244-Prorocentrum_lima.AAC.1
MEHVESQGDTILTPPVKNPRLEEASSAASATSASGGAILGAPEWAQAIFSQMTVMLRRQDEIVQDMKALKGEKED